MAPVVSFAAANGPWLLQIPHTPQYSGASFPGGIVFGPKSLVRRARLPRSPRRELLGQLPRYSRGAEIGVWRGDFSAVLLRTVRPSELHLIDPWQFETGNEYGGPKGRAWYAGSRAKSQEDMDAICDGVRRRFAEQIDAGVVRLHRASSADVAARMPPGSLDWAYIDGNHLYEYVRADLDGFARVVRPGGLLAGDDFAVSGWYQDGVQRAVIAFLGAGGGELLYVNHSQFLIRLPD